MRGLVLHDTVHKRRCGMRGTFPGMIRIRVRDEGKG
jgi:hypothetical protein